MKLARLVVPSSFAALLAFALVACGDDEETVSTPKEPPELSIESVTSAGGPTWTPASGESCVEVGQDPAGTIVVTIQALNFSLRPPGACGSLRPCGIAVLFVDGAQSAQSGTDALGAPFGADAGAALGEHTFRVELRDHLGDVLLDPEQKVISAEVVLEVRAPGGCGSSSDAGSDAPTDAPVDAPEDTAADSPVDAPSDAGSDSGDAGSDGSSSDAASDASGD
jgi:hypothetical protein